MARGTFILEELRQLGFESDPEGGERFEWDADRRSSPLIVWRTGGTQRIVRTDYPGASKPTLQVLGPKHKQTSLEGHWWDKYNFDGFAEQQKEAFERMARRGRVVRASFVGEGFGGEVIEGVIADWDFDRRRAWDIGYTFVIEPISRPSDEITDTRSPPVALNSRSQKDRTDQEVEALGLVADQLPLSNSIGAVDDEIGQRVSDIEDASAELDAVIEQRNINTDLEPNEALRAMASGFRAMSAIGFLMTSRTVAFRADTHIIAPTPIDVLDFEVGVRGSRQSSRLLIKDAGRAARELDERADPTALAFYEAQRDDNLYQISERFYGTPFEWQAIADRNNLSSFNLEGGELLIIPNRPVA